MRRFDTDIGAVFATETAPDLDEVRGLIRSRAPLAIDTENTGKLVYVPGFASRLTIFGTLDRAYVVPTHVSRELLDEAILREVWYLNRTYDLTALEQSVGLPFADAHKLAQDVGVLSRTLDSRPAYWGGTGHSLDELSKAILGLTDKGDAKKALMAAGRALGLRKQEDVYAQIPLDCPEYITYAGNDPMLTARLGVALQEKIRQRGLQAVVDEENVTAYNLAQLTRNGMLLDKEWTERCRGEYIDDRDRAEGTLRAVYGINPSGEWAHKAAGQIVERFREFGVKEWPAYTKKGKESLTQNVLKAFIAKSGEGKLPPEVGAFATVLREAQEGNHFAGYADAFLSSRFTDGRIHPTVTPLAAVTGRMSISNPPLQQIPSRDPRLRGCLIADEGETILSADYDQIEVRVACGISRDRNLYEAIVNKEDVYLRIANILGDWDGPPKKHPWRPSAKVGILGPMYGSGPDTLADQLGIPRPVAVRVRDAVDEAFPGLRRFANRATQHAKAGHLDAVSFTGRPLVIDGDRPYTAFNVLCQGQARDIMARAFNRLCDAGLRDHLRLVIHDEIVASVPTGDVEEARRLIDKAMFTEFRGVPCTASAEDLGPRWRKGD